MPNIKLNKTKALKILNNYFMKGGSPKQLKKNLKKPPVIIKPNWCEISTNPNCLHYSDQ